MQESLFTMVRLEDFVPADHPLRPVRLLINQAPKRLNGLFSVIYADSGHASIAPEKLLRALLMRVFYSSAHSILNGFMTIPEWEYLCWDHGNSHTGITMHSAHRPASPEVAPLVRTVF